MSTTEAATSTTTPESFVDLYLTKYKAAGEISAKAIKAVVDAAVDGKLVIDLCQIGDKVVEDECATIYKGKSMQKGLAFPTTISINNIICNFAPLPSSDEEKLSLKNGDVVKIQIGAQIDGLASIAAETVVVGASSSAPVTGRAADAIKAAYVAAEVAIRLMKPGALNHDISKQVENTIKQFDCKAVEGIQTNQFSKNEIDGKKKIVLNAEAGGRSDAAKLEEDEVYGVDISVTTSADGKTKSDESRTTIYRKTSNTYLLKLATSRKVFNEIQKKAGSFPFNLRALEDERKAKLGVQECWKHGLLTPFHVLEDCDKKAITAQVFFTVVINAKGAIRLTPSATWFSDDKVQSEKQVKDEKIKALLATPIRQTKKKNKKATDTVAAN